MFQSVDEISWSDPGGIESAILTLTKLYEQALLWNNMLPHCGFSPALSAPRHTLRTARVRLQMCPFCRKGTFTFNCAVFPSCVNLSPLSFIVNYGDGWTYFHSPSSNHIIHLISLLLMQSPHSAAPAPFATNYLAIRNRGRCAPLQENVSPMLLATPWIPQATLHGLPDIMYNQTTLAMGI
jgi:hypothetical protein